MHTIRRHSLALLALAWGALAQVLPAQSAPAAAGLTEAIAKGTVSLDVRARYESVDQTALKDAAAYTVSTRLGFTTAPYLGFKAMVEAEDVASPKPDGYNQAGINPGGAGKAVVADPVGAEINQAWLTYTWDETTVTAGRQRLVLDNARFVGDVGWRQNMQTFDAVSLLDKSVSNLSIHYAYLSQIDRVFGKESTQGTWDSDSHLLNISYAASPYATATGYAYLLDFRNAAANSCATYGASLTGAIPAGAAKLSYRIEYAHQGDYRNNPASYSTDYRMAELGASLAPVGAALGYEALGTDNNVGFKTPLATLHAFNGWDDLFLATPAAGLRDKYAKVSAQLPARINLLAFYHRFDTDTGVDLGNEYDAQVARKFGKHLTALVKAASFKRDGNTTVVPAKVNKFWVQLEYSF